MFKLLSKSKIFLLLVILINLSSLTASEYLSLPDFRSNGLDTRSDIIQNLFNEEGNLLFDRVIELFRDIETGKLNEEVCNEEEFFRVSNFLTFIATHGILPNIAKEEKSELEKEIQELLMPSDNDFEYETALFCSSDYSIRPAIFHDGQI